MVVHDCCYATFNILPVPGCMYACTSRVSPEDDRVIEIEHEGEREGGSVRRKEGSFDGAASLSFKGDGRKQLCLNYIEAGC